MKTRMRLLEAVVLATLVSLLLAGSAFGGTVSSDTDSEGDVLLPGDAYYWAKSAAEDLGLMVLEGSDAEAGLFLELAEERLAEAACLFDEGRIEEAEAQLERYCEQTREMTAALERVREQVVDFDGKAEGGSEKDEEEGDEEWLSPEELIQRVGEATLKHIDVLRDELEKAPEQAHDAIALAIEVSSQGHDAAVQAIESDLSDRSEPGEQGGEASDQRPETPVDQPEEPTQKPDSPEATQPGEPQPQPVEPETTPSQDVPAPPEQRPGSPEGHTGR